MQHEIDEPSLWDILKSNERENAVERLVQSNPGIFPSCLGRNVGVPCCTITRYTDKLESSGAIVRVNQKMTVTAGVRKGRQRYSNVRVNRLYPAGKVPEIDYDVPFEPSFASACTQLWYFLTPKEKMDVIIREIKAKGELGLTLSAIAKRIGMSRAIALKWVVRLENAGLAEVHKDPVRGDYYTATWKAIRTRSSVGPAPSVPTVTA